MSAPRAYLDWNASAPLRPEARAAMLAALAEAGNPSSVHAEGRRARETIEAAREQVAALAGCRPREVIFTSGASEAVQLALTPDWQGGGIPRPAGRAYVSAIEHPVVLAGGRFPAAAVERLPVGPSGVLDLAALTAALERHDPATGRPLVALMAANNETGVVQPVAAAAELVHGRGGYLVCDAVQAAGRLELAPLTAAADALVLSAHKIGGPQGIGALVVPGLERERWLAPLLRGAAQEHGLRGGTENVPGIAGFAAAAAAARRDLARQEEVAAQRAQLEQRLLALTPEATIVGAGVARLPGTLCIASPRQAAETLVMALDLAGIAVSAGAACSSGKVGASHVLAAMGLPEKVARAAIRISFGPTTGEAELEALVAAWRAIHADRPARTGERDRPFRQGAAAARHDDLQRTGA